MTGLDEIGAESSKHMTDQYTAADHRLPPVAWYLVKLEWLWNKMPLSGVGLWTAENSMEMSGKYKDADH